MSVPRDSPEQDDPVDESEIEHQLEVWVTLTKVVQVQTARTRNAAKTAKETSTMVFFVTLEGLTLGNLVTRALAALGFPNRPPEGSVLPFTYYHKGRGKECSGVKSEADFETMRRVLENKNITTVNIAFDNVDVQRVIGHTPNSEWAPVGWACSAHWGKPNIPCFIYPTNVFFQIPKVDVSSQCEVQLAKLTQELEKTWKCKWSADFTV